MWFGLVGGVNDPKPATPILAPRVLAMAHGEAAWGVAWHARQVPVRSLGLPARAPSDGARQGWTTTTPTTARGRCPPLAQLNNATVETL